MTCIKRLQRGVHNSLRSSIILFDLSRVVEELTYNSVDAGSTKVSISVSVSACYVKVEDDGCGITRDGLVILGERYATSKNHLWADRKTNTESLAFRGEALASLSDVSLLEVRTRARGKPNAYCKIIKGSKCLFLGIDDQHEAVGTTVIVRDLFYNQPVRRKYLQSSPKRVLHSVKKCVLRIALVHPEVSFKVTDADSEDELLCTVPSSSPLPLVSDGFGNEVSSSLHKLVFSDEMWTLSGYLSGPADVFSTKAFQYFYINSRFVCKGSIHNLVNSLVASFQCSLAQRKVDPEFHRGKRQKTQGYPAFLLNLRCPLFCYDVTYEPSKIIAEFKDWDAVLSFVERAMNHFWEQFPTKLFQGKSFAHENGLPIESELQKDDMFTADISERSNMGKRKCNVEFHQNSSSHISVVSPRDNPLVDVNVKHKITFKEMHGSLELKPCQSGYRGQFDYSLEKVNHDSEDSFASAEAQLARPYSNPQQWIADADADSFLPENDFFSNHTFEVEEEYNLSDIEWERETPEGSRNLNDELNQTLLSSSPYDIINNDQEVKFPSACPRALSKLDVESCSSDENVQDSSVCNRNHSNGSFEFDHLKKDSFLCDTVDAAYGNCSNEILNFEDTLFRGRFGASRQPFFRVTGKCQTAREFDASSSDSMNTFCRDTSLTEENYLDDGLTSQIWAGSYKYGFHETEIHLNSPDSFSATADDFAQGYMLGETLRSFNNVGSRNSGLTEEKVEFVKPYQNCYNEVMPSMSCSKAKLDCNYSFCRKRNMQYSCPSNHINLGEVSSYGILDSGTDWSLLDSSNVMNTGIFGKSAFGISAQNLGEAIESPWDEQKSQNCRPFKVRKIRSRRSCSAPPFYKGKHKFSSLNDHLTAVAEKDATFQCSNAKPLPENISSLDYISQPCCASQLYLQPNLGDVSQTNSRECVDEKPYTHEVNQMESAGGSRKVQYNQSFHTSAVAGPTNDELEYASATLTKWRTSVPQTTEGDMLNPKHKNDILDICSGLLHLSGGWLVPESINRDCLQDARVLFQLDKKFIPVMASGILIIIDQHAADERIRLEELRRKVLSGEGNSVTYLDSEQELVLPEMGIQLLQKYAEQIQKWGWICNVNSQCSESFAKTMNLLKRRACCATLVAVPCILGINLTDKDLIEFIEQLVETDGSSTLPPSVVRILNYKACRGAIMFGDSLLPSESSLILEELKATSLCFQCAHGRPTAVPLLNMASLNMQLARLETEKGRAGKTWHGLCQHVPTIARAQIRLDSAKRFHNG